MSGSRLGDTVATVGSLLNSAKKRISHASQRSWYTDFDSSLTELEDDASGEADRWSSRKSKGNMDRLASLDDSKEIDDDDVEEEESIGRRSSSKDVISERVDSDSEVSESLCDPPVDMDSRNWIFDHFLVLSYSPSKNSKNAVVELRLRYSNPKQENVDLPRDLGRICYPEEDKWSSSLEMDHFVSIITSSDGSRQFVFIRRSTCSSNDTEVETISNEHNLESATLFCFCLITNYPFFSIFQPLMEIVQTRWLIDKSTVLPVIQSLLFEPFPQPGSLILSLKSSKLHSLAFTRGLFDCINENPTDRSGQSSVILAPLEPLFNKLSPTTILYILSLVLTERRIIFASSSTTTLSECIYGILTLMSPFSWQHILVPVLPSSLSHYTSAPMPYIVGVLSARLPSIIQNPLDEVFVVDLDSDIVNSTSGSLSCRFPSAIANKMIRALDNLSPMFGSKLLKKGREALARIQNKSDYPQGIWIFDHQAIINQFLAFYAILFGHFFQCIHPSNSSSQEHVRSSKKSSNGRFDLEKFISHPIIDGQESLNFYQQFCQTQLFDTFLNAQIPFIVKKIRKNKSKSDAFKSRLDTVANFRFLRICELLSSRLFSEDGPLSFNTALEEVRNELNWSLDKHPYQNKLQALKQEMSALVMECTGNKGSQSPADSVVTRIVRGTFHSDFVDPILSVLWFRLSDCNGRNWRHGFKSMRLMKKLLLQGSDRVLMKAQDRLELFEKISFGYQHREIAVQQNMRAAAENLVDMLTNLDSLHSKRKKIYKQHASLEKYLLNPTSSHTVTQGAISYRMDEQRSSWELKPKAIQSKKMPEITLPAEWNLYRQKVQELAERMPSSHPNDVIFDVVMEKQKNYRERSIQCNGSIFPPFEPMHKSFFPKKMSLAPYSGFGANLGIESIESPVDVLDLLDFSFQSLENSPEKSPESNSISTPSSQNFTQETRPDYRTDARNFISMDVISLFNQISKQ